MGFIRKEIGEREKKLLEDFTIEEKELALPFLLEDEKRGIFLCVKQFRIGEGKYQVLAMMLGGHLLEFRLEEERADRYPVSNEEDQSAKGLSTETISQLVIPKVLKGREDKIVTVIQHALSQINPYYDTKIREVNHVEYR